MATEVSMAWAFEAEGKARAHAIVSTASSGGPARRYDPDSTSGSSRQ